MNRPPTVTTTAEIALRSALLGLRTARRWLAPRKGEPDLITTAEASRILEESIANVEYELDRIARAAVALDSDRWPTDPTEPTP